MGNNQVDRLAVRAATCTRAYPPLTPSRQREKTVAKTDENIREHTRKNENRRKQTRTEKHRYEATRAGRNSVAAAVQSRSVLAGEHGGGPGFELVMPA